MDLAAQKPDNAPTTAAGMPLDMDSEQVHGLLLSYVRAHAEENQDSLELMELCRDFRDGHQWTEEELRELAVRNQPKITINKMVQSLERLEGVAGQQRSDPKAYPRTYASEGEADAATDGLRYVDDSIRYTESLRPKIVEHFTTEGPAVVFLGINDKGEIEGEAINPFRWIWDPQSRREDYADACFVGEWSWMTPSDIEEQYGEDARVLAENSIGAISPLDDYEGLEDWRYNMADPVNKTIRCVSLYWRHKGTWHYAPLCLAGLLADPIVSPAIDDDGEPSHPYVATTAYVEREGRRKGVAERLLDLQREVNMRRSRFYSLMNKRGVIYQHGAFEGKGPDAVRREVNRDDYAISAPDPSRIVIGSNADIGGPQLELYRDAKSEFDEMAPSEAIAGGGASSASGRSLQIQQAGGIVTIGPLLNKLGDLDTRVYRRMWALIRKHWTGERWLRVRKGENPSYLLANPTPQTVMALQQRAMMGERFDNVAVLPKPMGALDMEIIVEAAPDTVTLRQEQFTEILRILPAMPPQLQEKALRGLLMSSELRDKQDWISTLDGGGDPEQQAAAAQAAAQAQQLQETAARLELEGKALSNREIAAKIEKMQAETEKAEVESVREASAAGMFGPTA